MRTIAAGETTLLASSEFVPHARVWVEDPDGVFRNLTNLSSIDWVKAGGWKELIDDPIARGSVTLHRAQGALSLSPLDEDSTLNQGYTAGVGPNNYAPLLDMGREVKIDVAVTAKGGAASTWYTRFHGEIKRMEEGSKEITLKIADLGEVLARAYAVDKVEVAAGTALHTAMQSVLDQAAANGWIPALTLVVPTAPSQVTTALTFQGLSIFEILKRIAQSIGWDFRYWWDTGTNAFQPTLLQPDRTKTTADITIGPTEYITVDALDIDIDDVRSYVRVWYVDSVDGQLKYVEDTATAIAGKIGFSPMTLDESGGGPIDTTAEAEALRDAALSDVSAPPAEQKITDIARWQLELRDLVQWSANAHYTTAQKLAVTGLDFRFDDSGRFRTVIDSRGTVLGQYQMWIQREVNLRAPAIHAGFLTWGRTTFGVDPTGFEYTPNAALADSVLKTIVLPEPITMPTAESLVRAVSADTATATYDVLPRSTTAFTVAWPEYGFVKVGRHEPRDADGNVVEANVKTFVIYADGSGGTPGLVTDQALNTAGTVGHGYARVQTETGGTLSTIVVTERHGGAAGSPQTPDRGPGDPSLVYPGRNLVQGEYEHDIPLHQSRESFEDWRATFESASDATATITFPRNIAPSLETAEFGGPNGRNPIIKGDPDTLSVRVFSTANGYDVERDGAGPHTLPEATDPGSGNVHVFTFQARNKSVAEIDGSEQVDETNVPLSGGGAVGAQWERDSSGVVTGVQVSAPAVGSRTLTITLDSTAVATDVRLYAWWIFQGSKSTTTEITGSLNKAIDETAIEAEDTYTWASPFTRISSGSAVRLFIIAEIENATPIVIDTHEVETIYNGTLA